MFTRTSLKILLFESRSALSPAQQGTGRKGVKSINLCKIFVYIDISKLLNAKKIYKFYL